MVRKSTLYYLVLIVSVFGGTSLSRDMELDPLEKKKEMNN